MKNKKYTLTAKIKPYWIHSEEECDCHECFRETRETIDAENIFDAKRQFENIVREIRLNDDGRDCYINNCEIEIGIETDGLFIGFDTDWKWSKHFEDLIHVINRDFSDVIKRDPRMLPRFIANRARKIMRDIALKTTYSNKVKNDEMIKVRGLAMIVLKDLCPDVSADAMLISNTYPFESNYSFNLYLFRFYREMLKEMRYHKELNATMPYDIEPNNMLDAREKFYLDRYLKTENLTEGVA